MTANPDDPRSLEARALPPGRKSPLMRFFIRGLVLLLPTMVTVWILSKIIGFLQANVVRYIAQVVAWILYLLHIFPAVPSYLDLVDRTIVVVTAWVLCLLFVVLVGIVFGGIVGRRVWTGIESSMMRFPVIRFFYPHIKQVTDFMFSERKLRFNQVVAVQYPRKGIYSVGFVTGSALEEIDRAHQGECLSVFVPNTPTPVTGFVIFVPREEVIFLSLSIDDAFKLIISGGVIKPNRMKDLAVESPPAGQDGGLVETDPDMKRP